MPTRRKPDDADALRVDAPLLGPAAHQADRALRILEGAAGRFTFAVVGPPRHAVLQNDSGDADGIEPGSDFLAFKLPVKIPITAARAYQHRSAGLLVARRVMNCDRWFAHGRDEFGWLRHLDLFAIQLRRHANPFRPDGAVLLRGCPWPKVNDERLASGGGAGNAHRQKHGESYKR